MHFGLSPIQSGGDFDATIAECERAEAAGFDSVWLGEHHNSTLLYPAPLVGLAAIAARTRRVRLGTGVLLLPLYHPLAVAEEAAMVDVVSRGRLILGVGAGYAPEEFTAFGVSMKERGSRLDEAVPLIHRLWSEDAVSHAGRHYRIGSATLRPRPVQRPRPPIWFAGWVEAALRRAGRLGDAWLGGPSAKLDELAGCVRMYREAMRTAGRDAGSSEVAPGVLSEYPELLAVRRNTLSCQLDLDRSRREFESLKPEAARSRSCDTCSSPRASSGRAPSRVPRSSGRSRRRTSGGPTRW